MKIGDLDAPPELIAAWSRELQELTAIQEKAVHAGVLAGHGNLLIVAPTTSGKSLIGEMAATKAAFGGRRHAILAVPMRSLADEHYISPTPRIWPTSSAMPRPTPRSPNWWPWLACAGRSEFAGRRSRPRVGGGVTGSDLRAPR